MSPEFFSKLLKKKNIHLNKIQLKQFDMYFQMLVEWNEKVNLTAITEEKEVYLKHFYDSITASFYFDFSNTLDLCDVGAGAGFPSIPLKICYPQINVTIVDSLQKRIGFLENLMDKLELKNVSLYHSRAEDFGQNRKHREVYDVVMARAVARMSVLSEYCLPLVKKSGIFIAMKGSHVDEEISDAKKAINILGGSIKSIETFTLPKENSERSIVLINKQTNSPKNYPRRAGIPNKNPIS